ncbi:unnamed protein product [Ectocarpus sp. 6 AP-2014]
MILRFHRRVNSSNIEFARAGDAQKQASRQRSDSLTVSQRSNVKRQEPSARTSAAPPGLERFAVPPTNTTRQHDTTNTNAPTPEHSCSRCHSGKRSGRRARERADNSEKRQVEVHQRSEYEWHTEHHGGRRQVGFRKLW